MGTLTEEEKLALGSSDLKFLLTTCEIQPASQGTLFEAGVNTLAKFAAFVASEADLKEVLKSNFSLDPATSLANRAQIASYVVAWSQARTRIKAQAEAEAKNEIRDWTKPSPMSEYLAMRQAFAKAFGEPEDKHVPSKEHVEKKLSELEGGEFRAEALSEIVSRGEVEPDVLLPVWDSKGHISVKKDSSSVAMPSGPEQLRLRLTVMCNAIRMLS